MLKAGDKIGWTYRSTFGAISFTYDGSHRTYFSKTNIPQTPVVGDTLTFESTPFLSKFAVSVELSAGTNHSNEHLRLMEGLIS